MISITFKDIQTEKYSSDGVVTIDHRRGVNPCGERPAFYHFTENIKERKLK